MLAADALVVDSGFEKSRFVETVLSIDDGFDMMPLQEFRGNRLGEFPVVRREDESGRFAEERFER